MFELDLEESLIVLDFAQRTRTQKPLDKESLHGTLFQWLTLARPPYRSEGVNLETVISVDELTSFGLGKGISKKEIQHALLTLSHIDCNRMYPLKSAEEMPSSRAFAKAVRPKLFSVLYSFGARSARRDWRCISKGTKSGTRLSFYLFRGYERRSINDMYIQKFADRVKMKGQYLEYEFGCKSDRNDWRVQQYEVRSFVFSVYLDIVQERLKITSSYNDKSWKSCVTCVLDRAVYSLRRWTGQLYEAPPLAPGCRIPL